MSEISLKEYFERTIDSLNLRVNERFRLNDEAIAKAERAMNERLNSMNEFRDALRDQSNKMATRAEVEKIDDAVQSLQNSRANLDGRLVVLSALVSIIAAIAMQILLRKFT